MPYIRITTNVSVDEEQAERVKQGLGEAIRIFPGKSEAWLMVSLEDHCRMWFQGKAGRPIAIADISIFGKAVDSVASEKMTAAVSSLLEKELGVRPEDLYIKYAASENWGWNGSNF